VVEGSKKGYSLSRAKPRPSFDIRIHWPHWESNCELVGLACLSFISGIISNLFTRSSALLAYKSCHMLKGQGKPTENNRDK
jgi:hypothetical protein